MKVDANFRRRASEGEDVRQLNSLVISGLSKIDGFFLNNDAGSRAVFNPGTGESAGANLSMCLAKGVRGSILYASRVPGVIKDKATSDDFIKLELDLGKVDYFWFAVHVFPKIVQIFEAYRASIVTDEDQEIDDFDEIVELSREKKIDIIGRDSVFRIQPVNYFDNTLCIRAFGLGHKEVAARLAGKVCVVEEIGEGVFFVAASAPVFGEETLLLDAKIKNFLA